MPRRAGAGSVPGPHLGHRAAAPRRRRAWRLRHELSTRDAATPRVVSPAASPHPPNWRTPPPVALRRIFRHHTREEKIPASLAPERAAPPRAVTGAGSSAAAGRSPRWSRHQPLRRARRPRDARASSADSRERALGAPSRPRCPRRRGSRRHAAVIRPPADQFAPHRLAKRHLAQRVRRGLATFPKLRLSIGLRNLGQLLVEVPIRGTLLRHVPGCALF
jgi:hypothetical protein